MSTKYPPFVNAYGKISDVFKSIKEAAVPPKFTTDFIYTVLGLKSTSYRAMIPLLKRLGFVDQNNVPTQIYKDYRDDDLSKIIMAERVRSAYADLYRANEYAHKLAKAEINSKLRTLLGVGTDDTNIANIAATFLELAALSDFDNESDEIIRSSKHESKSEEPVASSPDSINIPNGHSLSARQSENEMRFGISYTINLNLPATTEIEVFNAIFRSLKENLLR